MSEYNPLDKLQRLMAQKNAQAPAEVDQGMIMQRAEVQERYLVYTISLDEEMYDIDAFMEESKKFKRLTYEGLVKNAKDDHNTKQEVELLADAGMGLQYRYVGDQTGETFEVTITPDEIKRIQTK